MGFGLAFLLFYWSFKHSEKLSIRNLSHCTFWRLMKLYPPWMTYWMHGTVKVEAMKWNSKVICDLQAPKGFTSKQQEGFSYGLEWILLLSKHKNPPKSGNWFKGSNLPAGESTPLLLLILNETLSFIPSTKNFLSPAGFVALHPASSANSSLLQNMVSEALNF